MSERRTLWNSRQVSRKGEMNGLDNGHVLKHGGLLGLIIEGISTRGRLRMKYIQQIINDQGCNSYEERRLRAR